MYANTEFLGQGKTFLTLSPRTTPPVTFQGSRNRLVSAAKTDKGGTYAVPGASPGLPRDRRFNELSKPQTHKVYNAMAVSGNQVIATTQASYCFWKGASSHG